VRSLQRGLDILQIVNQHNGLTVSEVAQRAGVPRPTAYRLLETLEGLGYVARDASSDGWRPTLQTKSLSSGFRDEDWVASIAVPMMIRLGRRLLWPLDLVTFRDYRMAVRASTHNMSPFSVDKGMVGRELPILETAGGRAHLAFVPPAEGEAVLTGLRGRYGSENVDFQDDGPLERILERTRELGLGYRIRGSVNRKTMSLSAPVLLCERPVACLTIIWIASALKFEDALSEFRAPLLATARAMSEEMARATPQEL